MFTSSKCPNTKPKPDNYKFATPMHRHRHRRQHRHSCILCQPPTPTQCFSIILNLPHLVNIILNLLHFSCNRKFSPAHMEGCERKNVLFQLPHKPPWPNGQGVGLLIRRLWVRVPQEVLFCACTLSSNNSCAWHHPKR